MLQQISPTGPMHKAALLLQKWGGMAKYRHHPNLARLSYRLALLFDSNLPLARRELAKARPRPADGVQHLIAHRLDNLSALLGSLKTVSRDFH